MFVDAFDKKCLPAFYNSFLKIELKCDKENHVNFKSCNFQKKMLSNLTCSDLRSLRKCALEDGLKDSCVLKIL